MEAALKPAPESPEPLSDNLGWLLQQASYALLTEMNAGLESLGILPRGHCVLSAAMTGSYSQSELANMIGLDKTTMVVLMDELESAGLAKREPSPTDRRARVIAVTPKGKRKAAQADEIIERIQRDVLGSLPARERDAFVDALTRLVGTRLAAPVECEKHVRRRTPR